MKLFKKYAGLLLAILLCVTMSVVAGLPVSADLVQGPAPDFTVEDPDNDPVETPSQDENDTPSQDETDTPSEGEDDTSSDGYVDIEDPFGTTSATESGDTESGDTESTDTESTESSESDVDSSEDTSDAESSYDEEYSSEGDDDENYGSATYYPGNGEDITGNAGSGSDDWGANYSEGATVSKSNNSTAKKDIADYQGQMLDLIWIPIVLIVLAAGTLIGVNLYFAKKKGKGAFAKPRRKK